MKYTLTWRPSAQARLTEIWLAARDRDRISESVRVLEEELRRDPHHLGESRELDERVILIDVLAVKILIDDVRQTVQVRSIRRYR